MSRRKLNAPAASSKGARRIQDIKNPEPMIAPPARLKQPSLKWGQITNHPLTRLEGLDFTKSVIDPKNAPAASIPDMNVGATASQKLTDFFTLKGVGTAGGAYAVIVPSLYGGIYKACVVEPTAGATMTNIGTGSDSDWYSSISSDVYSYRITSYCVEVSCMASDAVDSGVLSITQYAGVSPPATVTISNIFNDDGVRGPAKDGAAAICRPFVPPTFHTVTTAGSSYMPVTVVAASGLPTTTDSLVVTITWNVELVYNGATLGRTNSRYSSCNMVDCCIAANCTSRASTAAAGPNAYDKLVAAGKKLAREAAVAYLKQHFGV